MSGERTRARVTAALRCPACHEDLVAGQPVLLCPDRHAAIHEDCAELLPRCPVLGCEAPMGATGEADEAPRAVTIREEDVAEMSQRLAAGRRLLLGGALTQARREHRSRTWLGFIGALAYLYVGALAATASTSELPASLQGPAALAWLLVLFAGAVWLGLIYRRWREAARDDAETLEALLGGEADSHGEAWTSAIKRWPTRSIIRAAQLARRARSTGEVSEADALQGWRLLQGDVPAPPEPRLEALSPEVLRELACGQVLCELDRNLALRFSARRRTWVELAGGASAAGRAKRSWAEHVRAALTRGGASALRHLKAQVRQAREEPGSGRRGEP